MSTFDYMISASDDVDGLFQNSTYAAEVDYMHKSSGRGGYSNMLQTFFTGMDRFHCNPLPANMEHSGLTFITRPRLNLTTSSIRQSTLMAPMDTKDVTNISFAIRCLLDPVFAASRVSRAYESPLLDIRNPFLVPLCNSLVGISGFPNTTIATATTEGGYHSEDITVAIGSDGHNKSYDLSLTFKDVQNGPIISLLSYWCEYIANVTKGIQLAYKDDIDAQRLNYTVSIYRFMLDPTRRFITRYAKATGCFPKMVGDGEMFNFSEGDIGIDAVGKFTIPFTANKIEYNRYPILLDFQTLVRRYCPAVASYPKVSHRAINNYYGIPWVVTSQRGLELVWKSHNLNHPTLDDDITAEQIATRDLTGIVGASGGAQPAINKGKSDTIEKKQVGAMEALAVSLPTNNIFQQLRQQSQ